MNKSFLKQWAVGAIALSATLLAASTAQATEQAIAINACKFTAKSTIKSVTVNLINPSSQPLVLTTEQKRMGTKSATGPTPVSAREKARNLILSEQNEIFKSQVRRSIPNTFTAVKSTATGTMTVTITGALGCAASKTIQYTYSPA